METNHLTTANAKEKQDALNEQLLQLLIQIQQGNQDAFSEFYDLTVKRLFSVASYIIGNDEDAEEIICDVYTQIWQNAHKYNAEKGAVLAWCYVITRSRSLDRYRINKKRHERLTESASDWQEQQKARLNKFDALDLFSVNSLIWLCFDKLGIEQRNILSLVYISGMSHKEISVITGHPVGTIKSHVSRSIQKVNQYLLELDDNDKPF